MRALDILGDPVRRRVLGLLADGGRTSGAITDVVRAGSGLSQPAVPQHPRVLRDSGSAPLSGVDAWSDPVRRSWEQRLDALGTEPARGRRAARSPTGGKPVRPAESSTDADETDSSAKGIRR